MLKHCTLLLASIFTLGLHASSKWVAIEKECCDDIPSTDTGFYTSPGNMGPNAFSNWIWHVKDAKIVGDKYIIETGVRMIKDGYDQWTETAIVKVEIPFGQLASLEFSNLYERWKLNETGFNAYEANRYKGSDFGDIVVSIKFNFLKETKNRPVITLTGSFKTASGSEENARFTDSAGYIVNLNFAKDLITASGVFRKLRLMGELGFLAWDDGLSSQNDAYRYGAALNLQFAGDTSFDTGIHGYTGWRDNGDKPLSLYVEGKKVFTKTITAFAGVDIGLNSSNKNTSINAGVRIYLNRKYKERNQNRNQNRR